MATIYKMRRRKLPGEAKPCLERLAQHADEDIPGRKVEGVAFVCLMDDGSFIADTCGTASTEYDKVRQLLRALDAKVAKRQLNSR